MRPSDLPPAERYPHGARARYVCGCRCDDCRRANREYAAKRAKAQIYGDWNGLVDAGPVRAHLRRLARRGLGRRAVAAACDIPGNTLRQIASGAKSRIRARSAKRILAVTVDAVSDGASVSAAETWRLIRALLKEGFTKAELARRFGYKRHAIQFQRDRVLARTAQKVKRFYRAYRAMDAMEAAG